MQRDREHKYVDDQNGLEVVFCKLIKFVVIYLYLESNIECHVNYKVCC